MKKSILMLLAISLTLFASVSETTVGCEDKNSLKTFMMLHQEGKMADIKAFYKFSIENDCEIIDASDEIKLIGKPYSDGTALIYSKKYKKDLYIRSNTIKNQYTPDNHKLNKSF